MINTFIFDFSRVLLHPIDKSYTGDLNPLHAKLKDTPNYVFLENFKLNDELITFLDSIKNTTNVYIFTKGTIQNVPEIRKQLDRIFKKIYSQAEIGIEKTNPNSYLYLSKDLEKKPEEILFIDDSAQNIEAAKAAGLHTHLYTGNEELIATLKNLLKID